MTSRQFIEGNAFESGDEHKTKFTWSRPSFFTNLIQLVNVTLNSGIDFELAAIPRGNS